MNARNFFTGVQSEPGLFAFNGETYLATSCLVFSFDDFATASIARDANSETGVLLVITTVTGSGTTTDIEFSLHATRVHP